MKSSIKNILARVKFGKKKKYRILRRIPDCPPEYYEEMIGPRFHDKREAREYAYRRFLEEPSMSVIVLEFTDPGKPNKEIYTYRGG